MGRLVKGELKDRQDRRGFLLQTNNTKAILCHIFYFIISMFKKDRYNKNGNLM